MADAVMLYVLSPRQAPRCVPVLHDAWPSTMMHNMVQMRNTTESSYLAGPGPEGMGPLQHVALFQSQDTSRGRGVYCLAMPMEHRFAC